MNSLGKSRSVCRELIDGREPQNAQKAREHRIAFGSTRRDSSATHEAPVYKAGLTVSGAATSSSHDFEFPLFTSGSGGEILVKIRPREFFHGVFSREIDLERFILAICFFAGLATKSKSMISSTTFIVRVFGSNM
jgi:hypothetical protein